VTEILCTLVAIALITGWVIATKIKVESELRQMEMMNAGWTAANERLTGLLAGNSGDPNNNPDTADDLLGRLNRIATGDTDNAIQGGDEGYGWPHGKVGDDPTDQDWPTPPSDGLRNRVAMIDPTENIPLDVQLGIMQQEGVPHDLSAELYDQDGSNG
jgi:hypothetical protein